MELFQYKRIFAGALFALVFAGAAWAQDTQEQQQQPINQTDFYVKQVIFDKIYTAPNGYIVQYRTGVLGDKKIRVALPYAWFDKSLQETGSDGTKPPLKGEVILLGTGSVWPHLVVYSKGGALDHVRLYVSRNPNHITWGTAYDSPAVQKIFSEAENWNL
ncbi:MAG: hypothetical protein LBG72_10090 [Spirochaetaceae bacterium]|nr:hypothetical protein [Spirochaetaceae bacterium]